MGDRGGDGPQAPGHPRRRLGGDHVAHAPRVADRGHRRHVAGRGHLPDLSLIRGRPGRLRDQQREGQADLRGEPAAVQQDREGPRRLPDARARDRHRRPRAPAAHGGELRRHLRPVGSRAGGAAGVGGALADLPPRQGRHHRPHLRHDRRSEGRGADPRQHPAQLRGRHPGRGLQRARPLSLVPAAVAHDRARSGSGRAAGSWLHDRLCRADHLAAGGQHGRDRADRDGGRAAPVRDPVRPGAVDRRGRPGLEPAHLPLGDEARPPALSEPSGRSRGTRSGSACR